MSLSQLHPGLVPIAESFVQYAQQLGYHVTVTNTVRTRSTQERLYRRWRAGLSPYPAARPGTSLHERGLAWDMDVRPRSGLAELGKVWEQFGRAYGIPTRWGGRFRDPIHFEVRP